MAPGRDFTRIFNFVLDNVIPPLLRDSKYFMLLFFYPLFGKKSRYFIEFKEKAPFFSDDDLLAHYKFLSDVHLDRKTDMNNKTIRLLLENITGETILDIACGRGYMVELLGSNFPEMQVFGMDIVLPLIDNKPPNVFLKEGGVEKTGFPNNHFDTVICAHTLEHVRDIDAAVNELRRVCRKKLIIVVPCQREYKYTFDLHLNFFPYMSSLRKVMKNPGASYQVTGGDFVYIETVSE